MPTRHIFQVTPVHHKQKLTVQGNFWGNPFNLFLMSSKFTIFYLFFFIVPRGTVQDTCRRSLERPDFPDSERSSMSGNETSCLACLFSRC